MNFLAGDKLAPNHCGLGSRHGDAVRIKNLAASPFPAPTATGSGPRAVFVAVARPVSGSGIPIMSADL